MGCIIQSNDALHHAVAVVIFLPIVLAYTAWVYRVLHGKVTPQLLETDRHAY